MPDLKIQAVPADDRSLHKLIGELDEELLERYPAEDIHGVDFGDPGVREMVFAVAFADGVPAACGGIRRLPGPFAELKRFYVAKPFRRQGMAAALLAYLEDRARELGALSLRLETGPEQPESLRFYEKHGYHPIAAFGPYAGFETSLCYEKALTGLEGYRALSSLIDWGPVKGRFGWADASSLDEALVSNVSIIPYTPEGYVVFQLENGRWELPGGTMEPGETYLQTLRREMAEELGAELVTYRIFGQFHCESVAAGPYKPHIPHPLFIRLLGYGEVQLTGRPLNPPDGEQVALVETVPIEEAVRRFESQRRSDIADMYRAAHDIREREASLNR